VTLTDKKANGISAPILVFLVAMSVYLGISYYNHQQNLLRLILVCSLCGTGLMLKDKLDLALESSKNLSSAIYFVYFILGVGAVTKLAIDIFI
jgi:hypothetical protein